MNTTLIGFLMIFLFVYAFLMIPDLPTKEQLNVKKIAAQKLIDTVKQIDSKEKDNNLYIQSNILMHVILSRDKNASKDYIDILEIENFHPKLLEVYSFYIEEYNKISNLYNFYVQHFKSIMPAYVLTIIILSAIFIYNKTLIKCYEEKSYILITNEAEKEYSIYKRNKNAARIFSISALIFAVFTGLLAAAIYDTVWFKKLLIYFY